MTYLTDIAHGLLYGVSVELEAALRRMEQDDIQHQLALETIRVGCWTCPKAHAVFLGIYEKMRMDRQIKIGSEPNIPLSLQLYGAAIVERCDAAEGSSPACKPGNSPSVAATHSF